MRQPIGTIPLKLRDVESEHEAEDYKVVKK